MHISACYYVPRQLCLIILTETISYKLVKNPFKLERRTLLFNKDMNHLWRWLGDRSISLTGKGWGSWACSSSRREHIEQISSMHTSICWDDWCQENGSVSLWWYSAKTSGNSHRQKHRKSHLNVRKNFFSLKETEWKRCLRVVVKLPSLEIFKTHLNVILCNLFLVNLV